jgi:hypothetical protein
MDSNLETHHRTNDAPASGPSEVGSELDRDAARGAALLSAGAEIIAQALSADSNAFLQASRQSGGQ